MANEHIINNNLIISGSVTSSVGFAGDGSGLTNITAEAEWDGSRNGDSEITGSFIVSGSGANVDFTNAEGGVSGSFSGSFEGDGSGLTGITATSVGFDDITGKPTLVSGSSQISYTGITDIPDNIISSSEQFQTITSPFTGSFTGSFSGDASNLINVPASEWDGSRDGNASITGSLIISGSGITVDLKGDTTLDENIFISNTGDTSSIAIGSGSLIESDQTRNTLAIGIEAGNVQVSGSKNIYIGNQAGFSAVKTTLETGIGYQALYSSIGLDQGSITHTSNNTAVGACSLYNTTTGFSNTAAGNQALKNNITGCRNVATGHIAACRTTSGCKNTALGSDTLVANTTGCDNSVAGAFAGRCLNSNFNTAIGSCAFLGDGHLITGNSNTALGYRAGQLLSGSACGNLILGSLAGPTVASTLQDKLYINNAQSNSPLICGDFSTGTVTINSILSASTFSGSFVGDGSGITGITGVEWDGSRNGDASITGSLIVSGSGANVDFTNAEGGVSGSFSGSFVGDGSGMTGVQPDPEFLVYTTASNASSIIPATGSFDTVATSMFTTIAGGTQNTASSAFSNCSFIGAGFKNYICREASFLGAGTENCSCGQCSFLGAGCNNTLSNNTQHAIVAGYNNTNTGNCAFIGAGSTNQILTNNQSNYAFIGAGQNNTLRGTHTAIVAGQTNIACCCYNFIGAGTNNIICERSWSGIVTGCANSICGCSSFQFIGGGYDNIIKGTDPDGDGFSSIVGGRNNAITGACEGYAFIGGGRDNVLTCDNFNSSIVGGCSNVLHARCSFIGNGQLNRIKVGCDLSVIVGGCRNLIEGFQSTIVGGTLNTASAACSFIGGGKSNYINTAAISSSIVGGFDNITNFGNTHIIGSGITADKADYAYVNNLDVEDTVTALTGSFTGELSTNGFVVLSQVSESLNFVDDTAAAAGGVPLGGLYRNGNFIVIRLS